MPGATFSDGIVTAISTSVCPALGVGNELLQANGYPTNVAVSRVRSVLQFARWPFTENVIWPTVPITGLSGMLDDAELHPTASNASAGNTVFTALTILRRVRNNHAAPKERNATLELDVELLPVVEQPPFDKL